MLQSSKFAQIRAANNMKQIGMVLHNYHDARKYFNETLAKEVAANEAMRQTAQQDVANFENAPPTAEVRDNREKIRELYVNQSQSYSGKGLAQAGSNWGEILETKPHGGEKQAGKEAVQQFNDAWLGQNKLLNATALPTQADQLGKNLETDQKKQGELGKYGGRKDMSAAAQKPSAAQVAQGKNKRELTESNTQQQLVTRTGDLIQKGNIITNEQAGEEQRYKERLAQQRFEQPQGQPSAVVGPRTFGNLAPNQPAAQSSRELPPSSTPPPPPAANAPMEATKAETETVARPEPPMPPAAGVQLAVPPVTGMASLDFQLPIEEMNRWSVYRFTTPRGDVKITARSISKELVNRLGYAAGAIAVFLVIGFLIRRGVTGDHAWLMKSFSTTLMIVLGLLAIIIGVLPVLGVIAIIAGITLKIMDVRKKASVN
jgi:hypothetical protein